MCKWIEVQKSPQHPGSGTPRRLVWTPCKWGDFPTPPGAKPGGTGWSPGGWGALGPAGMVVWVLPWWSARMVLARLGWDRHRPEPGSATDLLDGPGHVTCPHPARVSSRLFSALGGSEPWGRASPVLAGRGRHSPSGALVIGIINFPC